MLSLLVTIGPIMVVLRHPPPNVNTFTPLTELTHNEGSNLNPTFSPDGKLIAFSSNRSGNFDIWLMNTFGRRLVRLTLMPGDELNPKWSPDGKKIAFLLTEKERTSIWIITLATLETRSLTEGNKIGNDFQWNPNSLMLAYDSETNGTRIVSTVDANGHRTQLTQPDSSSKYPSWSPNGDRIAFSSNQFSKSFDIYTMNMNGNGLRQLTAGSGFNIKPRINPLGDKILFLSNRTGNWDLWTMNPDGINQSQVMKPSGEEATVGNWKPDVSMDSNLEWDPNGLKIVFTSTPREDSNEEIFIVHQPEYKVVVRKFYLPVDDGYNVAVESLQYGVAIEYGGRVVTRISTSLSRESMVFMNNLNPCWSPDGKRMIFQSGRDGNFNMWIISFARLIVATSVF